MITMADIRKRIDNLNSHFIKCEFNINNMNIYPKSSQSTEKIIYNNAMYMINNWRSFNENTNNIFLFLHELLHNVSLLRGNFYESIIQ